MTVKKVLVFVPSGPNGNKIEKEADVVELIREVRADISAYVGEEMMTSLGDALTGIKTGEYPLGVYESPKDSGHYEHLVMDLTAARKMIDSYGALSERRCHACSGRALNEHSQEYCGACEKPEDASRNGSMDMSPRVMEFRGKDCPDCKPKFRPLEEVLKGVR